VSAKEHPQQPSQQLSLYRRHRPRTFAEVEGQEPVVRTLRNAVRRGKVHHAYLFVGSRGTGKTSMAKILAACLNCERGPTDEPCGQCESCTSIARASSLDVIEMDAASNNSVDDIRELRESVAYAPVSGRRKVYILDEAHMFSTAAWNAFLKTLEEPPPDTVFVLATTEAQKVPPTVVDRCHRFDFHRPTADQIASVVRRTAQAESIDIPPAAVAALARSATGSFRDALGTLEQLVTYSGKEIALEDVLAVLGVADAGLLEQAVDAVAIGDARGALKTLAACIEQGRDAGSFAGGLEARLRELLIVQTLDELPAELSLTPEADAALRAQAGRVEQAVVIRLMDELAATVEAVRAGADPRTRLELALVKAAKPEVDSSMRALLARIERLERERPAVSAVAGEREIGPAGQTGPRGPAQVASFTERAGASTAPGFERQPAVDPDVARSPAASASGPAPHAAGPTTTALAPPPDGRPESEQLELLRSLWPAVVDLVRVENALLGALIAEAQPVAVAGEGLTVAFASSAQFLKKKAEDPANRLTVAEALRAITGGCWRVSYELREVGGPHGRRAGSPSSEQEWVRRLMEEFDAEELPGDWDPFGGKQQAAEAMGGEERGA
jgi:DNA polymerase III subunit gamma/tau